MDQAIKRKWVKALLSGEYEQCQNTIYDIKEGRYCCLGVLSATIQGRNGYILYPSDSVLPAPIRDALAGVNDAGVPFEMIAGLIDEAL